MSKFSLAHPWKSFYGRLCMPLCGFCVRVVRSVYMHDGRGVRVLCSTRTIFNFKMKSKDIRMLFIMIESILFPFKTRCLKFLPNSDKYNVGCSCEEQDRIVVCKISVAFLAFLDSAMQQSSLWCVKNFEN